MVAVVRSSSAGQGMHTVTNCGPSVLCKRNVTPHWVFSITHQHDAHFPSCLQEPTLFATTVFENIALGGWIRGSQRVCYQGALAITWSWSPPLKAATLDPTAAETGCAVIGTLAVTPGQNTVIREWCASLGC